MREELGEYLGACRSGDLPGVADALVDLVYVALGASVELGLPWDRLFRAVHEANMRKVRLNAEGGHKLGVAKPAGWQPPDVRGILTSAGWEGD